MTWPNSTPQKFIQFKKNQLPETLVFDCYQKQFKNQLDGSLPGPALQSEATAQRQKSRKYERRGRS